MRRYEIPVTNATLKDKTTPAYQISKLETGKEDLLRYLLCNNYEDISFINGNFSHVDKNGHDENVTLDQQQTETLYEALKQISLPETILPDLESTTLTTTRFTTTVFTSTDKYRETLNT